MITCIIWTDWKKGAKTLGSMVGGVGVSSVLMKAPVGPLYKLAGGRVHQNSQQIAYSIKDNLFRK